MEEIILSLEMAALDRWCAGDPWGWAEISAGDIIYIEPQLTRPLVGASEFHAYLRTAEGRLHSPRTGIFRPRIVIKEDTAVLTYICKFDDARQNIQESWNVTSVYFKQEGEWRLVHGHRSTLNHTQPAIIEIPIPVKGGEQVSDGVLNDLMVLESKAMERWRKGDPWGFIEISAAEVTYFDTGTKQRIDGREALAAEYTLREGRIFYDVMDFIDPRLLANGSMAVLVYRFLSTWLNPDGSVARRTPWNCTEVFRWNEENWLINHTHWSIIQGVRSPQ